MNGEVNEALQLVYTSHEQAPCSVLGIAFPALSGRAFACIKALQGPYYSVQSL